MTKLKASDVTFVIPTIEGREEMLNRAVASAWAQEPRPPGDVIAWLDIKRWGAAAARNAAINSVTTPVVAFLDDDDEVLKNHLHVLLRGMNKSGADMVYSYAEFVGGRDPLGCWHHDVLIARPINIPFDSEAEFALRRDGNHIPLCYIVKTDMLRDVGGFPERNSNPDIPPERSGDCEDYLLLLAMLDWHERQHRHDHPAFYHVVGVRTWVYHIHGTNTGGRGAAWMHELEGDGPEVQRARGHW